MKDKIVLGTRGSDLALAQTRLVESALRERWPDIEVQTRIIKTSGDEGLLLSQAAASTSAGRKGLFTSEIERALVAGKIDVAVHSAKDLPSTGGDGTDIAAVLPRAPIDDVLVSLDGYDLETLPSAAAVATASVRRRHQLLWKRPDLNVVGLRGNVPTRLRKLIQEQWNGIVLARAGLERLGFTTDSRPVSFEGVDLSICVLPRDIFVPAGGQGIIAMQIRNEDKRTRSLVDPIDDPDTRQCLRSEREFLRLLECDCNQPVGVFAIVDGGLMKMRAQVFRPDTATPQCACVEGNPEDAERLASDLLKRINDN